MVEDYGQGPPMPKGWHVRTLPTNKGDVRVQVVCGTLDAAGTRPLGLDVEWEGSVEAEVPPLSPFRRLWLRLTGRTEDRSFPARFRETVSRARRRAWELNEAANRAKRLVYELETEVERG